MAIDDEFASYVSESATDIRYPVIQNDGATSPKELANRIANIFGLKRNPALPGRDDS
jgi:hypothetical protein